MEEGGLEPPEDVSMFSSAWLPCDMRGDDKAHYPQSYDGGYVDNFSLERADGLYSGIHVPSTKANNDTPGESSQGDIFSPECELVVADSKLKIKNRKVSTSSDDSDDSYRNGRIVKRKRKGKKKNAKARPKPTYDKTFSCPHCPYTTKYLAAIKTHKDIHANLKKHKCHICEYESNHSSALRRHVSQMHKGGKVNVYNCHICHFKSTSRNIVREHVREVHSIFEVTTVEKAPIKVEEEPKADTESTYNCSQCDFQTKNKHGLRNHTLMHTNTKPYSCNFCEYRSNYPTCIRRHVLNMHKNGEIKIFKCHLCSYENSSRNNLRDHVREIHKLIDAKLMEDCGNDAVDSGNAVVDNGNLCEESDSPYVFSVSVCDISTKQEPTDVLLTCSLCEFSAITESEYADHFTECHGNIAPEVYVAMLGGADLNQEVFQSKTQRTNTCRFTCDLCHYKTPYKTALISHLSKHDTTKRYKCKHCSYDTKYKTSMHRHIKYNHIENASEENAVTYRCDQCPYTTPYKNNLRAHKRKHSLVKEYKCGKCDYETAYQHIYAKHCRSHDRKDRNVEYSCDLCPFNTKEEGRLMWHLQKIHGKECEGNSHQCPQCGFYTKVKWRLTVHMQRSQQDSPIECQECDFKCNFTCQMKSHKKSHAKQAEKLSKHKTKRNSSVQNIVLKEDDPNLVIRRLNDSTVDVRTVTWDKVKVREQAGAEKRFSCYQCDYSSKHKAGVQRHYQRIHMKLKPFKCDYCSFAASTRDSASLHTKRSFTENILSCNKCDLKTNYKCEMLVHEKVHYEFRCEFCTFSCKKVYDLNKHYTCQHKVVRCPLCDFSAASSYYLQIHVKDVHSERARDTLREMNKNGMNESTSEVNESEQVNECNSSVDSDEGVSFTKSVEVILEPSYSDTE